MLAKGSDADTDSLSVQDLLVERRDTLKTLVEHVKAQYRAGDATYDSVVAATNSLLEAQLDLATTKTERIEIRKSMVENLRAVEQRLESRRESGLPSWDEYLRAKAARLLAEIRLARETDAR